MVTFTRLLLLNLHLISYVYGGRENVSENVKWLEAERSVLVRLETPDLFFWDQRNLVATNCPGAFVFNFTLTSNSTLLVNDEPILPRAHAYIPTPLRAYQTGETATKWAHRVTADVAEVPTNVVEPSLMNLDYYLETPDATSSTSIYNSKYNPRIRLDILRVGMPGHPGYSTALSSDAQNQIWLWLEDVGEHPANTPYADIPLRIARVDVQRRWLNHDSPGTTTYKTPQNLKTCHIWSWLCADLDAYPYYEYVYRSNFDQYGKKGSMRHFVTRAWGKLVGLVGLGLATAWLTLCGSLVLLSALYAMYRSVRSVVEMYQKRVQEVDDWVADEEVEGLLQDDRYFEDDLAEAEKEVVVEDREGRASVDDSLHPPPPYTPVETERSSA